MVLYFFRFIMIFPFFSILSLIHSLLFFNIIILLFCCCFFFQQMVFYFYPFPFYDSFFFFLLTRVTVSSLPLGFLNFFLFLSFLQHAVLCLFSFVFTFHVASSCFSPFLPFLLLFRLFYLFLYLFHLFWRVPLLFCLPSSTNTSVVYIIFLCRPTAYISHFSLSPFLRLAFFSSSLYFQTVFFFHNIALLLSDLITLFFFSLFIFSFLFCFFLSFVDFPLFIYLFGFSVKFSQFRFILVFFYFPLWNNFAMKSWTGTAPKYVHVHLLY